MSFLSAGTVEGINADYGFWATTRFFAQEEGAAAFLASSQESPYDTLQYRKRKNLRKSGKLKLIGVMDRRIPWANVLILFLRTSPPQQLLPASSRI